MLAQELLQREGGMIALVRDGSRSNELAQLFNLYSWCLDVVERPFLDATRAICEEFCEKWVAGDSMPEYLTKVRASWERDALPDL